MIALVIYNTRLTLCGECVELCVGDDDDDDAAEASHSLINAGLFS